jgi:hypothetical protein
VQMDLATKFLETTLWTQGHPGHATQGPSPSLPHELVACGCTKEIGARAGAGGDGEEEEQEQGRKGGCVNLTGSSHRRLGR